MKEDNKSSDTFTYKTLLKSIVFGMLVAQFINTMIAFRNEILDS